MATTNNTTKKSNSVVAVKEEELKENENNREVRLEDDLVVQYITPITDIRIVFALSEMEELEKENAKLADTNPKFTDNTMKIISAMNTILTVAFGKSVFYDICEYYAAKSDDNSVPPEKIGHIISCYAAAGQNEKK